MRTFIIGVILSLAVIFGTELAVPVNTYSCDNYFEEVLINGIWYRIEYSCIDGSIVSIINIDE